MLCIIGAFDDEEIVHVEGDVDPARDLEIIHSELRLKDLEYLNKNLDGLERSVARGGDKKRKPEFVCKNAIIGRRVFMPLEWSWWHLVFVLSVCDKRTFTLAIILKLACKHNY